jgi:D-erythro-7,8-dihydroneopterin triphosphate epimerase
MTDAPAQPPLDRILIRDLQFRCIVGVDREERMDKQDIVVQIELHIDLRAPGRTDSIEDTVDYRALKRDILRMAEDSRFYLIEALAQSIADICLTYDRIACVDVTVEKPGALRFARTVGVRITRARDAGPDQS